jgi:hypothetical protein
MSGKGTAPASTPAGKPGASSSHGLAGAVDALKKRPAVAAGVAGVVVVLFVATRGKSAGASSGPASTGVAGEPAALSGGVYDSTANDVYNSLAGQLQQMQSELDALGSTSTPAAHMPAPAPKPGTKPKPKPVVHKPAPRPKPKPKPRRKPKPKPVVHHLAPKPAHKPAPARTPRNSTAHRTIVKGSHGHALPRPITTPGRIRRFIPGHGPVAPIGPM